MEQIKIEKSEEVRLSACACLRGRSVTRVPRDEELLADYRAALREQIAAGSLHPRRDAIRQVVYGGKPRYHVSFERAYLVTCKMLSTGGVPLRPSLRSQM